MNTKTEGQYRNDQAYRDVQDWLDDLIERHEELVTQLKRRKNDFDQTKAGNRTLANAVDLLAFTVNDLNNTQRNLRLDRVPDLAASLAVAKEMMKAASKKPTLSILLFDDDDGTVHVCCGPEGDGLVENKICKTRKAAEAHAEKEVKRLERLGYTAEWGTNY